MLLFNNDFYSAQNQLFFAKLLNDYSPRENKPIVFLPCASAKKTRRKFGKKRISHSFTHQLMSAITKNTHYEKIILSEPLTVIPYSFESQMPDYDYPPEFLAKNPGDLPLKDDWQFVRRLGIFLYFLKEKQPYRKRIYYCGGLHHYKILRAASENVNLPIVAVLSRYGTRDYAYIAKVLNDLIITIEKHED